MQQSTTVDPFNSFWEDPTVATSNPWGIDSRYIEIRRRYVTPNISTTTNTGVINIPEDLYTDDIVMPWYESVERPWIHSPMEDWSAPSTKHEHDLPTSAVPFIVTDGDVMRDLFGLEDENG